MKKLLKKASAMILSVTLLSSTPVFASEVNVDEIIGLQGIEYSDIEMLTEESLQFNADFDIRPVPKVTNEL